MSWPNGLDRELVVDGLARDLATPAGSDDADAPEVIAQATLTAVLGDDATLESIRLDPSSGDPGRLVGTGLGRGFGRALSAAFPDDADRTGPGYFLAEDLKTARLISTFALSRRPETRARFQEMSAAPVAAMEGICAGYRPGGLAIELRRRKATGSQNVAVGPTPTCDDHPLAWESVDPPHGPAMCRRRRIDVRRVDAHIEIDAMFRDHTWDPDGAESVVHEYELLARVDPERLELQSIDARPRVIPYPDCPAAAPKVQQLAGGTLPSLRSLVLEELRGVDSCTHLNDMLRALAELPELIDHLPAAS